MLTGAAAVTVLGIPAPWNSPARSPSCAWSKTSGRSASCGRRWTPPSTASPRCSREIPAAVAGPAASAGCKAPSTGTPARWQRPRLRAIVGSGPHAPTLHWVRCDGPVRRTSCCCSTWAWRTAALHRRRHPHASRHPARFSPVQRHVHDLVERPTGPASPPGRAPAADSPTSTTPRWRSSRTGSRLGPAARLGGRGAVEPGQHHRRYLVCGIGHHLGLDVHDCAQASYEAYQGRVMTPGMVLTVEPGLYFHADDRRCPAGTARDRRAHRGRRPGHDDRVRRVVGRLAQSMPAASRAG